MYDVSVPMALVDFIPVVLFAVSAWLLQHDFYNKMPKYAFACLAAGTIDAFIAGLLKALWKLLYAAGICDFHVLNTMFMPTQSLGLFLAGLGLVLMLTYREDRSGSREGAGRAEGMFLAPAAPAVFSGTMIFVSLMVLGLGGMCAALSAVAARMKKKGLIAVFVLTFFCYMAMGYLSSRDSASSAVNWMEQGINTLGQLLMLCGVLSMHRAGLRGFRL